MKLVCRFTFLFLIVCQHITYSQLCQGSLGDPVVKITFGAGQNPGPPLKAGVTNYIYQTSDCPSDGFYAVRNSTASCFSNTWQNIPHDHTGDANGYFMLVNASIQPNDFYVDTVRGLCPSTTFEFAAWIMSMLVQSACGGNGIKPNITFSIEKTDGTLISSYNTGDINSVPSPLWQQYGFFFTTPSGISDIVLRMTNKAPGGCGNDLVLDDITFRPCGPIIQIGTSSSLTNVKNVCAGQASSITINSSVSAGYTNPVYQWQSSTDSVTWADIPQETNTIYTTAISAALPVGSYFYRLAISEKSNAGIATCRINSDPFSLHISPNPTINIIVNNPVCETGTLELKETSGNLCSWSGPNGFTNNNCDALLLNMGLANAGLYYITATSSVGCTSKDSILIKVTPKSKASVRSDTTICENGNVYLNGGGTGNYAWTPTTALSDPLIANPLASPAATTTYLLTLTNGQCTDTASVMIKVAKKPVANAGVAKEVLEGYSVILDGTATGGNINYYWTPNTSIDNAQLLTPTVNPTQNTTYTLHVISTDGCGIATNDVLVHVFSKIIVPNSFSPNNDGINDVWNIHLLNTYPEVLVSVFDRYGNTVFENKGYANPWDGTVNGKPVPVGTYYYVIDTHSPLPKITGWVFIIR